MGAAPWWVLVVAAAWAKPYKTGLQPRIAVVGSANLDTTLRVGARLPVAGETVVASGEPVCCCGGKGLNQAVAAAKIGDGNVHVAFCGRVGDDGAGGVLRKALESYAVDAEGVETVAGGSGQGFVLLEEGGRVLSVVSRGANWAWDEAACDDAWAERTVSGFSVILLQREVPEFVNEAVARAAARLGIPVVQDGGGEDRPVADAHLANCASALPCPGGAALPAARGRRATTTPRAGTSRRTSRSSRGSRAPPSGTTRATTRSTTRRAR